MKRPWRFVAAQWSAIDADCAGEAAGARTGWLPLVVLVTVAVSLTLQSYWGDRSAFQRLFPYSAADRYWALKSFAWWALWRVGGFAVLPVAVIWAMPGERVRDYFVTLRGLSRHVWLYVALYAAVVPVLLFASRQPAFFHMYPFYKQANRSRVDLWSWECLYVVQFAALEFFFRGFMLRGLRRFGSGAIFVMIVPYCMIHYGKPLPETLGAIVAGLVLGTLAMRTKSIWGGALVHVAVALTMDGLALAHCPPASMGPCTGP